MRDFITNNNLYIKTKKGKRIWFSEIFVDYIIFGGQDALCKAFANEMKQEFEMSMFGEIKFFVDLQVYRMKYVYTSLNQSMSRKY